MIKLIGMKNAGSQNNTAYDDNFYRFACGIDCF